jgi:hypothetical protein
VCYWKNNNNVKKEKETKFVGFRAPHTNATPADSLPKFQAYFGQIHVQYNEEQTQRNPSANSREKKETIAQKLTIGLLENDLCVLLHQVVVAILTENRQSPVLSSCSQTDQQNKEEQLHRSLRVPLLENEIILTQLESIFFP